jgi:hypothetical protein
MKAFLATLGIFSALLLSLGLVVPGGAGASFSSTELDVITEHLYRGSAFSRTCNTTCQDLWSAEQESSSYLLNLELLELRQQEKILPRFGSIPFGVGLGGAANVYGWKVASAAPKVIMMRVPPRSPDTSTCSVSNCAQSLLGVEQGNPIYLGAGIYAPVSGLKWTWKVNGSSSTWSGRLVPDPSKSICNSTPAVPFGMTVFEGTQTSWCESGRPVEAGFLYPRQLVTTTPVRDFTSQSVNFQTTSGWSDPKFATLKSHVEGTLEGDRYPYLSRWYHYQLQGGCDPEGGEPCAMAQQFVPVLRFDTSEQWRPLNVSSFFEEEQHILCEGEGEEACDPIPPDSPDDLMAHNSSDAYLDIGGTWEEAGDEVNYHSPYEECTSSGLRECDTGPRSAIYWRNAGEYGEHSFIDYWYFYRFNYFYNQVEPHEADWEGVTIAPSSDTTTFDYAAFSQHGTFYSYLRDVLRCENTPAAEVPTAGTCGTEAERYGQRVNDFPANGSHANYTTPCSETGPPTSTCSQNGPGIVERGYDGQVRWGRAFDDPWSFLIELPPNEETSWQYWFGKWGTGNVESPGLQSVAMSLECATVDNEPGCEVPPRASSSALHPLDLSAGESAVSCASWAGPDVSAIACNPGELRKSVQSGRVGAQEDLRIVAIGRPGNSASGRGISQYAAGGAVPVGTVLRLSGKVMRNTQVIVKVRKGSRRRPVTASFDVGISSFRALASRGAPRKLRLNVDRTNGSSRLFLGPYEANRSRRWLRPPR